MAEQRDCDKAIGSAAFGFNGFWRLARFAGLDPRALAMQWADVFEQWERQGSIEPLTHLGAPCVVEVRRG